MLGWLMKRGSGWRSREAKSRAPWATWLLLGVVSSCGGSSPTEPQQPDDPPAAAEDENVQREVVLAMSEGDLHESPHLELTELRPRTEGDEARARRLLGTLREVLSQYRDVDAARRDGYTPFLTQIEQNEYHFTSVGRTFAAALDFDPAAPSALLYERHGGGFELVGAMYTAPRSASLEELDARVPLSYARWHAHVRICLPPLDVLGDVDWTRFGPQGSIATPEACDEAGGHFLPQVFGWMVHLYPFEEDPEDIWGR